MQARKGNVKERKFSSRLQVGIRSDSWAITTVN
jgi:hypothetical protein